MGRPKKSAPKHVEPEDISQDVPDEEPASVIEPESVAAQPSMSKADACRAALAAGIEDAEEAQKFTRKKFGVEIKATDFALYKGKAKQAAVSTSPKAEPAKRGRPPKAASPIPAVKGRVAPPEKSGSTNGEPDVLLALEGVKELVGQFGADRVKRMVDLLG